MMDIVKSYSLLIVLIILLTGCQGDQADDLDRFMQDAAKGMTTKVPPLPEVQPYIPEIFNVDGSLPDPFTPKKLVAESGNYQPDLNRPKEPLELFPLENLKYVGALSRKGKLFALIKTPDNTIHQVKKGNYVGTNFGSIVQITEFEVSITENVQDEMSGDWVERISALNLQE